MYWSSATESTIHGHTPIEILTFDCYKCPWSEAHFSSFSVDESAFQQNGSKEGASPSDGPLSATVQGPVTQSTFQLGLPFYCANIRYLDRRHCPTAFCKPAPRGECAALLERQGGPFELRV